MLKKLVVSSLFIFLLSSCVMTPNKDGVIDYNGTKLLSKNAIKQLPRTERLERILSDMQKVGFKHIRVSDLVDSVTASVLAVYRNQYKIITEYKTLLDNHRDVMSFLMANQGKTDSELQQEITRFDDNVELEQEKIGPKIKAYNKASDKIWQENVGLGLKLTVATVKLADTINKHGEDFLGVEGVAILLNGNRFIQAYQLSEVRLHLAKLANEFIKDERAIIDISKQLQEQQNSRIKG